MKKFSVSRITNLWFITLLCVACSCGKMSDDNGSSYESYDLHASTKGENINEIFSGVEFVPLKFTGDYYPSYVKKLRVVDDLILISDVNKRLYVFTKDGDYVGCSAKKFGNGPGEYSIFMGFSWNPFSKSIELLTPTKILSYDPEFNLKAETKLPSKVGGGLLFNDVFAVTPTRYILHPTVTSDDHHRVILYDSSEEKIISETNYSDDLISHYTMQPRDYYRMPDSAIMMIPHGFSEWIYRYDSEKDALEKIISVTSPDNSITRDEFESLDKNELKPYMRDSKKYMATYTLPTMKRLLRFGKNGPSRRYIIVDVIDRESGEIKRYPVFSGEKETIFPFIEDADEQFAYAIVDKEELEASPTLFMDRISERDSILSLLQENEDKVMLKYRFR